MKIAIWTLREPKIEWIKEWVNNTPYLKDISDQISYVLEKVPSDVSDMPLSIEETMKGAENRARNLQDKWIEADYYVWIEWWTTDFMWKKYIFWSVYILNSEWEWHFGLSPMMEVPKLVETELYVHWKELWDVMWELSWSVDIRSENWSMWAWSDDMFTRRDEFATAFKAAIAPFYNDYYKL